MMDAGGKSILKGSLHILREGRMKERMKVRAAEKRVMRMMPLDRTVKSRFNEWPLLVCLDSLN